MLYNTKKERQLYMYFFIALYLLYAKLEEEHGLARHAMSVYERATNAVLPEERFDVKSSFALLYLLYRCVYNEIYVKISGFIFSRCLIYI